MTERKFKIGDKVKVACGHKGVIVDEIYNQITGRLFSVDFGENGFGQYKASDLTLIEEKPEHKYQKGDKVWNKVTSNIWEFVEYNEYKGELECVILFNETKCVASLSGIEPYIGQDKHRQYKKGDKVWHKKNQQTYLFYEYQDDNSVLLKELSSVIEASESDIEPYYHQDLQSYLQNVRDAKKESIKPTHPFTVILKSGVKVGISATIFDYINEQNSDTKSVQTVADGTIVLSEIAAIVPTENLMP